MNIKRNISTTLVFASLVLSAIPAGAASYHSSHSRSRYNTAGTNSIPMTTFAGHFCYLSMVEVDNTDTENETASCRVTAFNGIWQL